MFRQFMELSAANSRKDEDEDEERLAYSDMISMCQPKTPAKWFVRFFQDSLHVLCCNQLKTRKWKCLGQKERGRISTSFRHQKRCVRHMLCFLSSVPPEPERPHVAWLRRILQDAEDAKRRLLDCGNQKSGKAASDKLTFSMIDNGVMDDLDARFAEPT